MKNKKKLVTYLGAIGLFLIIVGVSYATFVVNFVGDKNQEIVIGEDFIFSYNETSNGLSITDSDILSDENGMNSEKYFDFNVKLQTQYEKSVDYYIYLTKDETSTLDESYIKLYLTDQNDTVLNDVTPINELEEHETYTNSYYLYGNNITSNNNIETVHNYRLRVWVDESYITGYQTEENGEGSHFSTTVKKTYKFKVNVATGTLPNGNLSSNWKDKTENESSYLALYTIETKKLPDTYSYNNETYTLTTTIDVSEQGNKTVLLGEYTLNDKMIAIIGQDNGVVAPVDSSSIFSNLTNITTMDLTSFDTTNVTSMTSALSGNTSLTEITVGCNYVKDNLTDIYTNSSIKKVTKVCNEETTEEILQSEGNLANNWKDKTTNKLNYLAIYTIGSSDLPETYSYSGTTYTLSTTIDVSEQSNGNVLLGEYKNGSNIIAIIGQDGKVVAPVDSSKLFYLLPIGTADSKLKLLDLSNLDTSNVINMQSMLMCNRNLVTLDISNFNTSNVTNMNSMFSELESLTSLDLSSFDTRNVTTMKGIFSSCLDLTTLDITSFDTSNVTDMSSMFNNCDSLKSIDLSSFDTRNVTTMYGMFLGCHVLANVDLTSFDTSKVTNMSAMFHYCYKLSKVTVGCNWTTANASTTTSNMFYEAGTSSVTKVCNE